MISKNIKLSPEFKIQTTKAIASIVVFVLVYMLIFIIAIAITALCVYGGIMIAITIPRLFGIALGIGLASLGFLVLFFLLKFLFKSNRIDRSHLHEITKDDQPELFRLISEIVEDVGTSFPKKVYLSADVNASVFYDSSFWSMFFPVKKNLQIGLGLVNSTRKEELKAILAHEFGHFSQRTMKVGSYVYNVNQIIFNMLNDNDSYNKIIRSWADASGYFSIFVAIAVKIVEGIQWVLRIMYSLVNKSYLALSREMEFHADEIAANVTGYEPLKNSLLRMNLADYSFNSVLSFYEGKISENLKSKNVFREQEYIMNFLAKEDELPIINCLPNVTLKEFNRFNKSKLVIENQWTSHPSTEERIKRLEKTDIVLKNKEHSLANEIFDNIIEVQERLTSRMFEKLEYKESPKLNPIENFKLEFEKEFSKNTFSKIFNGYYDDKNPIPFDINESMVEGAQKSIEDLFSSKMVNLVYSAIALESDIEGIKRIAYKTFKIKTFDYDGKKYKQKESNALIVRLQEELKQRYEEIKQNDIRVFHFFEQAEKIAGNIGQLRGVYSKLLEYEDKYNSKFEVFTKLSEKLQFVNFTTPFDQIKSNFRGIKSLESELKDGIKQVSGSNIYTSEITKEMRDNFESYISEELEYFGHERYFDKNLEVLFTSLNNYGYLLSRGYFLNKKELLDYKVSIIGKS